MQASSSVVNYQTGLLLLTRSMRTALKSSTHSLQLTRESTNRKTLITLSRASIFREKDSENIRA